MLLEINADERYTLLASIDALIDQLEEQIKVFDNVDMSYYQKCVDDANVLFRKVAALK